MPQEEKVSLEFSLHFRKGRNGRQKLLIGERPVEPTIPKGRVPRISKLMALAIKMDGMLKRGEVKNYSELATLARVSRARITQIMGLLNLAPDIQEQILFLPLVGIGRDPVRPRQTVGMVKRDDWRSQRQEWRKLTEQI